MTGEVDATVCAQCLAPVIRTANDKVLEAAPHRLGVYRPDGAPMRRGEFMSGYDPQRPKGHRVHICARPEQGELFAIPAGTDKTRGGRR